MNSSREQGRKNEFRNRYGYVMRGEQTKRLDQLDMVSVLVRDFGSECLRRFGDGHEGPEAQHQFMQWTEAECNRMNELFLGYDPETEAQSPWDYQRGVWNMPANLGHYLRAHYVPSDDEDRYAVHDAFMAYAMEITRAASENEGSPVDEWGWKLDAASEGLRDALLGATEEVGIDSVRQTQDGQKGQYVDDLKPQVVVLKAGIWMIEKMGMGNMALLPYSHATGHWRCEFHPVGHPDRPFFKYTSGSEFSYLQNHSGGIVSKKIKPEKLAEAILKSVPEDFVEQCKGELSQENKDWLQLLKEELKNNRVPEAFNEYSNNRWSWLSFSLCGDWDVKEFPVPPLYISPEGVHHPWDADLESIYGDWWRALETIPIVRFNPNELQDGGEVAWIGREYLRAIGTHVDDERIKLFTQAVRFALASICYGNEGPAKQSELLKIDITNVISKI